MRTFIKNDQLFDVRNNQLTQDEKDALIAQARSTLNAIEDGGDTGEAQAALDAANAIIACAPAGAVELTDEQIERHKTGLYEWVDGEQTLIQRTYSQELAELNAWKDAQEDALASKMSKVHMRNGVAEVPTIEAMRAAILTGIDATYTADKAALRTKYFGE
jgi:hypothetical protein